MFRYSRPCKLGTDRENSLINKNKLSRQVVLFVVVFVTVVAGLSAYAGQSPTTLSADDISRMQRLLQDWPEIGRYKNANAALPLPAAGQKRVVFLGDSITDFWIQKSKDFFASKSYVDRGISGQTAPQMLLRFRQDVINLRARAVVILAGTNDLGGVNGPETIPEIEGYITSMVELGRANGIKVVLCSILPVNDYVKPRTSSRRPADMMQINSWMKEFCSRSGCTYVDYYSHLLDSRGVLSKDLSNDGLHPNEAGYAIMQPLVERGIQEALVSK
jgi:lysophospholipase L1-like esterase